VFGESGASPLTTEFTGFCISLFHIRGRMWEWFAMNPVKNGYLIIDDTIWQRYGKKLEGVSYVWDSTISKKVFGTNVVLLIWREVQTIYAYKQDLSVNRYRLNNNSCSAL
jgi:DDE superfamily endonuclease